MIKHTSGMLITTGILFALLTLSGCKTPEQQRAIDLRNDANRCAAAGFQPGSDAMASCMNTAARTRTADENRDAWIQQRQDDDWNRRRRAEQAATDKWMNSPPGTPPPGFQSSNNNIDTTPQFDKDGNPNFDTKGNYQGCHGVGCMVDNPDSPN